MVKIQEYDTSNPSHRSEWERLVATAEGSTVFHTPLWHEIVSQQVGLPHRTLVAKVDGELVGSFTIYSVPSCLGLAYQIKSPLRETESVYGNPIVLGGHSEVIPLLLSEAEKLGRKIGHVEFYHITTCPDFPVDLLEAAAYRCHTKLTSILDLRHAEEELWRGIHSKTRNMIRKAQKRGVKVIDADESYLDTYYEMLEETLIGRAHIVPKRSYQVVLNKLGPLGKLRFLVALHNGDPVAGAIFLLHHDTVYFWSGASFRHRRDVAPNDLIQWELIKWAREEGYRYYDLLHIDPELHPGIARFKMRYGGRAINYYEGVKRTVLGQLVRPLRFFSSPRSAIRRLHKVCRGAVNTVFQ